MATKQLQLEILSVGTPSFTKTARGGYNSIELAFKNHSFDGKVEGKKLVDFNDKAVFEQVKALKPGQHILVTAEKGENEQFWKWSAIAVGEAPVAQAVGDSGGPAAGNVQPATGESSVGPAKGRVVGNTYETPEERALRRTFEEKKHRQIGRQGCINSAIATLSSMGEPFDTGNVIEKAKEYELFVFGSDNPVSDLKSDVPF